MGILDRLTKEKIRSWEDLDPETANKLMLEIEERDYRIFPFLLTLRNSKTGEVLEKIKWALPFSVVRKQLLSCSSCSNILHKECMFEIERIELLKNLNSDDPVLRDALTDAIKALSDIYDILNPSEQEQPDQKEKKNPKE